MPAEPRVPGQGHGEGPLEPELAPGLAQFVAGGRVRHLADDLPGLIAGVMSPDDGRPVSVALIWAFARHQAGPRSRLGVVRPGKSGGRYICELLASLPDSSAL